jgi:hypothetical protein
MNKEEIKQRINEIDKELNNEKLKKKNNKETDKLYSKISKLEGEGNRLQRPIYKKYLYDFPVRHGYWIKSIKPYVKEGIKIGLGVKYLNQIKEDDYVIITKRLIKEDLEKTNLDEINKQVSYIFEEISKIDEKYYEEENILIKEKKELECELNKREMERNKVREENHKIIKEKLSDYIENIRKCIKRGLILNELE